jgi:bifunctional UDP-N-acetylglucosamine pyrophosphorylase/glucosamine-1-phosphate N-acetyltransferase
MTNRKLAVVVLAAGEGTRMKARLPKVLHPLAGKAMLSHVLDTLAALAPERTVVVVGPDMAPVAEAARPHPTVVQEERLGTGHAVGCAKAAREGYHGTGGSGDVLVVYGDTPLLTSETLDRMVAARREAGAPAVLGLAFRPEDPDAYGRVVLDAEDRVQAIVEFADANQAERAIPLCNAGILLADGPRLFDLIDRLGNDNAKGEYYLTDIYALARQDGDPAAMAEADAEEVLGINSREELARAEAIVQTRLRVRAMDEGVTLLDPASVWLSSDTRLGRDVVIQPQVFFGPGVTLGDGVEVRSFSHIEGAEVAAGAVIGPFARLRPGTVLGAEVRVGNFVEVKNAVLEAGAKANHLAYIGDSDVGAKANIGAGTITCNYDGFAKHRTRIGEGAFIGSNSALVAPVEIGAGAIVGAGSTIARPVASDALALTRAEQKEVKDGARRIRQRQRAKANKLAKQPRQKED